MQVAIGLTSWRRLTGAVMKRCCRPGLETVASPTVDPTDRDRENCANMEVVHGRSGQRKAGQQRMNPGMVLANDSTGAGDFGGWDLGGDGSGAPMRFHRLVHSKASPST